MENPVLGWLSGRLARRAATFQELLDEAEAIGITKQELLTSYQRLHLTKESRTPDGGGAPYVVWALPPNFKLPESGATLPKQAEQVQATPPAVKDKKRDARAAVERAQERLKRNSGRNAAYLLELTERASRDPEPCPLCKRGTPRAEELRLKAILAVLDRAGVIAPRAGGSDPGESGPVIAFPPGTQIAIVAKPPEVEPGVRHLPLMIRADQFGAGE